MPSHTHTIKPSPQRTRWFTIIRLALVLLTMSVTAEATPRVGTNVGDIAPDFSITTLDNQTFRLKAWQGKKAVYLIFWATWCPNCKLEIPKLTKLSQSLKDKMHFLAINAGINDSVKKVKRYQQKYPMNYPIAFDQGSPVSKLFKVVGTPTQIIIDINGIIRYRSPDVAEDIQNHLDARFTISR